MVFFFFVKGYCELVEYFVGDVNEFVFGFFGKEGYIELGEFEGIGFV